MSSNPEKDGVAVAAVVVVVVVVVAAAAAAAAFPIGSYKNVAFWQHRRGFDKPGHRHFWRLMLALKTLEWCLSL